VVAVIRGNNHSKAILLMGHYDSVPNAPGASDDGSAIAAMLETIRALKSRPPLKNDVIFLFTDVEELGLLSAQAFADEHPFAKSVGIVLNFEASGSSGQSIMFETSDGNGKLVKEFTKGARYPVANSLSYEIYKRMPNDTDLTIFKRAGYPCLNFAYINTRYDYHTPGDNLENIDERSLQHHGTLALDLTLHFGNLNLENIKDRNRVYFNAAGFWLVHYPENLVPVLMSLAVLCFLVYLVYGFLKKQFKVLSILFGFIAFLINIILAPVVVQCIYNIISRFYRGSDERLLFYAQNVLLIGFVFIAAGLSVLFLRLCITKIKIWHAAGLFFGLVLLMYLGDLFSWRYIPISFGASGLLLLIFHEGRDYRDLTTGTLFGWTVIVCAGSIMIPRGSYLLICPFLFGTAQAIYTLISRIHEKPQVIHAVTLAVLSIPALLWYSGLIFLYVTAMGIAAIGLTMIIVSLYTGLHIPQIRLITGFNTWFIPGVLMCLGIVIILFTLAGLDYDERHSKINTLFYRINADSGSASWETEDRKTDEWTSLYVSSEQTAASDLIEAPAIPFEEPIMSIMNSRTEDDVRILTFHVTSERKASIVFLRIETENNIMKARLNRIETENIPGKPLLLLYSAFPEEGVILELTVNTADNVKIRFSDISFGLPDVPGFKPRPDYMMPASSLYSDVTVVYKSFSF